ncbi:MAG: hypothetical protein KC561_09475, partial [Myxococcales bacterium]|nr:hypothetical protein [Myxococcales bacterium]
MFGRQQKPETRARRSGSSARSRFKTAFQHTFIQAAMVLTMGCVLAFIIVYNPRQEPPPRPELTVGEPAPQDVIATRDMVIFRYDTSALEARQRTAVEAIRPVWDFEEDLVVDVEQRIRQTYQTMREQLQTFAEQQYLSTSWQPPSPDTGEGQAFLRIGQAMTIARIAVGGRLHQGTPRPDPIALLGESGFQMFAASHRDQMISQLGAGITPSTLRVLAQDAFSPAAEEALVELTTEVLNRPVVDSLQLVLAEQEGGLQIRTLSGGITSKEE